MKETRTTNGFESSSHDSTTEIHVLRESTSVTVIQCKKELGSQADDVLSGTPTFDSLLDFIATERLRSMPHKGSKWDEVLKWAESFARSVDMYSHSVSRFIVYSWESARLIWGSCRLLLQVRPRAGFSCVRSWAACLHVLDGSKSTGHPREDLWSFAPDGRQPRILPSKQIALHSFHEN